MVFLAWIIYVAAAIGCLICYIMVLVHFFSSGQQTLGIVCIVLTLLCGLGGLIAFVKGWMDGVGNVMLAWTICAVLLFLTGGYIQFAAGGIWQAGG